MDTNSAAYWQNKEPKSTKELNNEIKKAVLAIRQWTDAANIESSEDSVMIEAQIFWLEELLKLAHVEFKR